MDEQPACLKCVRPTRVVRVGNHLGSLVALSLMSLVAACGMLMAVGSVALTMPLAERLVLAALALAVCVLTLRGMLLQILAWRLRAAGHRVWLQLTLRGLPEGIVPDGCGVSWVPELSRWGTRVWQSSLVTAGVMLLAALAVWIVD